MRAKDFLRRLRDALWPAQAKRAAASQLVIYDDMFEDFEVLPASAFAWCQEQMAAIEKFAARHKAPDGLGWTDIYMRPPAPASIETLKIGYAPAAAALSRRLPEFSEAIASGFEDPQWRPIQGRAFGPSSLSAIVVYHDCDARHVRYFAVSLRGERAETSAVLAALAALPSPEPLMVVDWAQGRAARLDRADDVAAYLR